MWIFLGILYLGIGVLLMLASFMITKIAVSTEGYEYVITGINWFKGIIILIFWPIRLISGIITVNKPRESESIVEFMCDECGSKIEEEADEEAEKTDYWLNRWLDNFIKACEEC